MRVGSLCSGYEGIGLGLDFLFPVELAFTADIDPGACKILTHHFPGVPNLGDLTRIEWEAVEPVDVLTAGFPCQDVSQAGGRAGLRANTRTGVWYQVARAIDALQPSLVILENVRGLLSAGADCAMEPCPWHMGGRGEDEPVLRALGAVLGDLADIGFDAEWVTVPASAVGAPHKRERVFIVAWPADAGCDGLERLWGDAERPAARREAARAGGYGLARGGEPAADADSGTERPGPVEAWRGLVAAIQGDQEPGGSGDGEHAAAADADILGRAGTSAAPGAAAGQLGPGDGSAGSGGQAAADAEWGEFQRRGGPAVVGGTPPAAAGQAPQRQRVRRAAVDGGADAADTPRTGLEGVPVGRQGDVLAAQGDSDAADPAGIGRARHGWGSVAAERQAGHAPHAGATGVERGNPNPADTTGQGLERVSADTAAGRPPWPHSRAWRHGPGGSGGPAAADAEYDGFPACPRCGYREGEEPGQRGSWRVTEEPAGNSSERATRWGQYEPAIRRWESVLGRPAPRPAEPTGRDGGLRLSPVFVEWMQGLPEGWVTEVPGLTRTEQLKALGNGVVPQQCAYAIWSLLSGVVAVVPAGAERLMPTPNTMDSLPPKTPEQIMAHRQAGKGGDYNLREVILYEMEGKMR